MSTVLGGIEIQMLADVARLRQDMNEAKGIVGRASQDMGKMAAGLKTALGALGVGLSVTAFAGWIKGAINAADETSKLAQKIGLATKDVGGLQLAFRLSGVETSGMQTSMARLAQQMAKNGAAFNDLGLKTRNTDGSLKSTRTMLGEVADKFASMKDGTEKTAAAVELFGRAGADMIPLLNGGAAGLQEMDKQATQLGLTIDEHTGKAAEQFNDTLDLIGLAGQGVATQVSAKLLPTLTNLASSFFSSMTEGDRLQRVADILAAALKSLYSVAVGIVEVFNTVGKAIGGTMAAVLAAINGEWSQAVSILKETKTDITDGWKSAASAIEKAWSDTADATVLNTATMVKSGETATASVTTQAVKVKTAKQQEREALAESARLMREYVAPALDETTAETARLARQSEALGLALAMQVQPALDETTAETARLARQNKALGDSYAAAAEEAAGSAALQAEEAAKLSDEIGQSLTDALFRAFESGAGFAQAFKETTVNAFKTLILQPTIKAIVSPVAGAMAGMMPGAASAGGGAGGLDMGSIGSLISSAGSLGTIFGTGASMAMTGGFGAAMGSAGAMASAGMYGSAAAMGLGAVAPYALAAYALYEAFKHEVTPHVGSVVQANAGGVNTLNGDGSQILNNFDQATDTALRSITSGSVGILNSLSSAFGGTGGFGAVTRFAADGKDASIGQFVLRQGNALAGYVGGGTPSGFGGGQYAFYSSNKEQAFGSFLSDVAGATISALDSIQLPQWARDLFAQLGDDADLDTIQAVADAVRATQQALADMGDELRPMGGIFATIADLSGDAAIELAGMVGGLEALRAKTGQYVQTYYSADEQAAIAARRIFGDLSAAGVNLSGLNTTAEYRSLLEGSDVNTEQGRAQFAALLNSASAFAELAQYLQANGGTLYSLSQSSPGGATTVDSMLATASAASTPAAVASGMEQVSAAVSESNAGVVSAIEAMRAEIVELKTAAEAIATSALASARQLAAWDDGGRLVTVVEAA